MKPAEQAPQGTNEVRCGGEHYRVQRKIEPFDTQREADIPQHSHSLQERQPDEINMLPYSLSANDGGDRGRDRIYGGWACCGPWGGVKVRLVAGVVPL